MSDTTEQAATEAAMPISDAPYTILELVSHIACSYASASPQATPDTIAEVILKAGSALHSINAVNHVSVGADVTEPTVLTPPKPAEPAVPVKKSVSPDYIVCLEDGKKLKMLKRHLRTAYNLTPDEYRARWGLPSDYPMVAPNYAKSRSELATKNGLGNSRRTSAPVGNENTGTTTEEA